MKSSKKWGLMFACLFMTTTLVSCYSTPRITVQGPKGDKGDDGRSIVSVRLTDSNALTRTDTYTITFSDGTTTVFSVLNGKDGQQGAQGEKGDQGDKGDTGETGASLLTGKGKPDNKLGKDGDSYIDLDTSDYYSKADGAWTLSGNLKGNTGDKGDKGDAGVSLRTGHGKPETSLGNDGDTYIDLDTSDVYSKANGNWTPIGNIKGDKGETGNSFTSGQGVPDNNNGKNGDTYLDLLNYDIYVKENDSWTKKGNIVQHSDSTKKYTVTLDPNGGALPNGTTASNEVSWGESFNLPTLTREGYKFQGWFTAKDEESANVNIPYKQWYSTDPIYSDLNLFAQWQGNTYTITLNLNGATYAGETTIEQVFGDPYTLPDSIFKPGYQFTGWTLDGNEFASTGTYKTAKDITLLANFTETKQYTVTLNLDGGAYAGEKTIQVKGNDIYNLPSAGLTKDGKVFAGWYDNNTLWDPQGVYTATDNMTLTAKWIDAINYNYNVTLDGNGGTYADAVSPVSLAFTNDALYYGTIPTKLAVPTKAGYEFVGYAYGNRLVSDKDGNIVKPVYLTTAQANSEITLKAKYVSSDNTKLGDYYYFGKIAQSKVTDGKTILGLMALGNTSGDLEFNGENYVSKDGKYYRIEPILWDVVKADNGTYTLVSNQILDYQVQTKKWGRKVMGDSINDQNYVLGDIRAYLNGLDATSYGLENYTGKGFLDLAFTEEEKAKIQTTTISTKTSVVNDVDKFEETNDKIFILDMNGANELYTDDLSRIKSGSDYANTFIRFPSNDSKWWLRGWGKGAGFIMDYVDAKGKAQKNGSLYYHTGETNILGQVTKEDGYPTFGVVPVLNLKL